MTAPRTTRLESAALETLADRWLAHAERIYDAESELAASARRSLAGGESPSRWMLRALLAVRGGEGIDADFSAIDRSLVRKYARAICAALVAAAIAWGAGLGFVASTALAVIVFYVVEVRRVFVVLSALDGARDPVRDSEALVRAQGGLALALARVGRIAAHMLTGGLRGQGFVRSWCAGCIAVVFWYEHARWLEAARANRSHRHA